MMKMRMGNVDRTPMRALATLQRKIGVNFHNQCPNRAIRNKPCILPQDCDEEVIFLLLSPSVAEDYVKLVKSPCIEGFYKYCVKVLLAEEFGGYAIK